MKKIKLIVFITGSFLIISSRLAAQDFKTAVGLKFGAYENGPSIKYFLNEGTALEAIVGLRSHGAVLTGLYEIHKSAFKVPLLKFYYGFGGHLGAVGAGNYRTFSGDDRIYTNNRLLLGIDGVVGLEYKIDDTPIAISLDLNPRVEIATGPFFDLAPGLGLKYTF